MTIGTERENVKLKVAVTNHGLAAGVTAASVMPVCGSLPSRITFYQTLRIPSERTGGFIKSALRRESVGRARYSTR